MNLQEKRQQLSDLIPMSKKLARGRIVRSRDLFPEHPDEPNNADPLSQDEETTDKLIELLSK